MRRTLTALAALTLALASAQTPALTLDAAAALALEAAAGVQSSRLDLAGAERDRTRTQADPTTLRVQRLQVEHAVARAAAALRGAEASARDAAAGAYAEALEADDLLALADATAAIAAMVAEATRIQVEAGAATTLDLDRSRDDLAAARRDVDDARAARELAYDRLASLLGRDALEAPLERLPAPEEVPELASYLARLDDNAALIAAAQQVELAEAQLAAVDNPLSSAAADVAAARDRRDTAVLNRDEQRRSLTLLVRQVHNAALAAQARLVSARETASSAREDLAVQELRHEAGSISSLALERARLQADQAAASEASAAHALAAALRQIELTVLGAR